MSPNQLIQATVLPPVTFLQLGRFLCAAEPRLIVSVGHQEWSLKL
jgi:hypothetical protein